MAESELELTQIPNENVQVFRVDDECINQRVDEVLQWVDSLEPKMKDVEDFYSSNRVDVSNSGRREATAAKRMQDLMRKFGAIFRQITQHKIAGPFMHPVDVEGLGLHDYYEIIKKPMDFRTIKNKMEAKDGTGYKHVRQIYDDMRLVFDNAMKYNDEESEIYSMAKTLLEKFEEKWGHFLPKVKEEEEEEKQAALVSKKALYSKTTRELRNEICNVNEELEKLKHIVMGRCRKFTNKEKLDLGCAILKLSKEDIHKVAEIVAQANPSSGPKEGKMDIEIGILDEATLWRLKFFVKEALENLIKEKKEEMTKAGDLNGTENKVVSNKRNATNQAEGRRKKRTRL